MNVENLYLPISYELRRNILFLDYLYKLLANHLVLFTAESTHWIRMTSEIKKLCLLSFMIVFSYKKLAVTLKFRYFPHFCFLKDESLIQSAFLSHVVSLLIQLP